MLSDKQLRNLLVKENYLPATEADRAVAVARDYNQNLAAVLLAENFLSKELLGQALAEFYGVDFLNLRKIKPDRSVVQLVPEPMAKNKQLALIKDDGRFLVAGMLDPTDQITVNLIKKKTGRAIKAYLMLPADLREVWAMYRSSLLDDFKVILRTLSRSGVSEEEKENAIVNMVDTLLKHGSDSQASDIHIEPAKGKVVVRFRIDGVMHDVLEADKKFLAPIVSRLKIMAKMRTDEHRAAQDGKLRYQAGDLWFDVRVSIVPITEGENVVLRLLAGSQERLSLVNLGLGVKDLKKVKQAIGRPHGMILVTGPTGSGKTTTLYAVLTILNKSEVHIATIEDPVEYNIEGVSQIQVDPKTNLTFANGLRAIVRQDPDIIMVGEIRDKETAGIAVNSALTGHLVLSTLHTNDAPTALPRLIDMAVEPFLLASTINLIAAQRLVRKNCEKCRASYKISEEEKMIIANEPLIKDVLKKRRLTNLNRLNLYRGQGCGVCNHTGFNGRVGIFEVLVMTDEIRELVVNKADSDVIMVAARKAGMTTMLEDGLDKVFSGLTTLDEVLKAARG